MNKILSAAILIFLGLSVDVSAQAPRVKITTINKSVQIEIYQSEASNSWSFLNAIAGAVGLGARISDFKAFNKGQEVTLKRLAPGEYESDLSAFEYSYKVDLSKTEPGYVAHTSWISAHDGLLMLADLLPQNLLKSRAGVSIELLPPQGWTVHTVSTAEMDRIVVSDPGKAVFLIGSATRKQVKKIDKSALSLVVSGDWPFSPGKALDTAAKVLIKYKDLTRYQLRGPSAVFVAPMPVSSALTKWKAETRGSVTVLLIDPNAKFTTWIGQLAVIFTHELFHLWVPNSLQLQGDYDWFYEGFSLYQGLLTARDLKLISSEEFLNTLSRVLDSYLSYSENISLIDASERRWATQGSYIYDKGMLVAFMYDLISRTHGTRSLPDVYRGLFGAFAGKPDDANEAIIGLLSSSRETRDLCERYIRGQAQLDFESFLPRFGFRLNTNGNRSMISVAENLMTEQRRLIRSLGLKT